MDNHFDILVVGAGISGIGAGYHLQTKCPGKSYAILEGRETIGGTWDLFRYPGIRSDSDMYTLGFSFYPWKEKEAIADGPAILNYLHETSEKFNIKEKINKDKLKNSVNSTYFDKLKKEEKKSGFIEAVPSKKNGEKIPFFNLGPDNDWKKILDIEQQTRLTDIFKEDLIDLGYK